MTIRELIAILNEVEEGDLDKPVILLIDPFPILADSIKVENCKNFFSDGSNIRYYDKYKEIDCTTNALIVSG